MLYRIPIKHQPKTHEVLRLLIPYNLQFGANAKSIMEVGCASDPFLKYLDWIDERTCVAPYFVNYGKTSKDYPKGAKMGFTK